MSVPAVIPFAHGLQEEYDRRIEKRETGPVKLCHKCRLPGPLDAAGRCEDCTVTNNPLLHRTIKSVPNRDRAPGSYTTCSNDVVRLKPEPTLLQIKRAAAAKARRDKERKNDILDLLTDDRISEVVRERATAEFFVLDREEILRLTRKAIAGARSKGNVLTDSQIAASMKSVGQHRLWALVDKLKTKKAAECERRLLVAKKRRRQQFG